MMAIQARSLIILLRFADGKLQNEKFDNIFTQNAGDWLRFNAFTWIIWTDKTVNQWYEILRHHLTQADQVLIFPVDLRDRAGWSQEWVWEWIDQHWK